MGVCVQFSCKFNVMKCHGKKTNWCLREIFLIELHIFYLHFSCVHILSLKALRLFYI